MRKIILGIVALTVAGVASAAETAPVKTSFWCDPNAFAGQVVDFNNKASFSLTAGKAIMLYVTAGAQDQNPPTHPISINVSGGSVQAFNNNVSTITPDMPSTINPGNDNYVVTPKGGAGSSWTRPAVCFYGLNTQGPASISVQN